MPRVEVVDHGFADVGDGRVAEVITGVETVEVPGLGEGLPRPRRIVRVTGPAEDFRVARA